MFQYYITNPLKKNIRQSIFILDFFLIQMIYLK